MRRRVITVFGIFCFALISFNAICQNLLPEKSAGFNTIESLNNVRIWWDNKNKTEYCRIDSSNPYSGKNCLSITLNPPKAFGVTMYTAYDQGKKPFKKGQDFVASVYIRADKPVKALIAIYTYNRKKPRGKEYIANVVKDFLVSTNWKQVNVSCPLKEDAEQLVVEIRPRGTVCIDELKLERGTKPTKVSKGKNTTRNVIVDYTVPYSNTPPEVDGKLNESIWKNASEIDKFLKPDGNPLPHKTRVLTTYDDTNLYLGIECFKSNISGLVQKSKYRDLPDWSDDRIEFFFDITGVRNGPIYYLSINSAGIINDQQIGAGEWNPKMNIAIGKTEKSWILEISLPIRSLGISSLKNLIVPFTVGRIDSKKMGIQKSCLSPIKNFNTPSEFKTLYFNFPDSDNTLSVKNISRGAFLPYGYVTGANKVIYTIDNKSKNDCQLTFSVIAMSLDGDETGTEKKNILLKQGTNLIQQYYKLPGKDGKIVFKISKPDSSGFISGIWNSLFSSSSHEDIFKLTCNVSKLSSSKCRVFVTTQPMYNQLLDHEAEKVLRWNDSFSWMNPLGDFAYFASLQTAQPYSRSRLWQDLNNADVHVLSGGIIPIKDKIEVRGYLKNVVGRFENTMKEVKKHHAKKGIFHASINILGKDADGNIGTSVSNAQVTGWLPDPINTNAYIANVMAHIDKYHPSLWGVFVGDELLCHVQRWGLELFKKKYEKNPTPYMKACYKEIKNKYGFGKFSIPYNIDKTHPDYPYCQRAYKSWLIDRCTTIFKELRKSIKEKYPELAIISQDAPGGGETDMETWKEYADIGTFQLNANFSQFSQFYMYAAKMLKDISGLKRMTVVPHGCSDCWPRGAKSPEEMQELNSQLVRGGITAFHYWPGAWLSPKPYSCSVAIGWPYGWQIMMEMSKFIKDMPPIKFPKQTETAILRSNDTVRSAVKDQSFYIFTHIGQNSRGWFKFFTDTQMISGDANLDNYNIVYVSNLEYSRPETAEKLIEFVKNGGILICGDPFVFEHNINSESMVEYRKKLFGVNTIGKNENATELKLIDDKWEIKKLKTFREARKISKLDDNVKTIAEFNDGSPALTVKHLGKGKAFYFASQPFNKNTIKDKGWKRFFKKLHSSIGGSVGHDIWRFKLPDKLFPADKPNFNEVKGSVCLTGNFGFWDRFVFTAGERYNIQPEGEYCVQSENKTEKYDFKTGPLTNRLNVLTAPIVPGRIKYSSSFMRKFKKENWIEEFKAGEKKTITFDLKKPYILKLLRIYFSGNCPDMNIETSLNGEAWQQIAQIKSVATKDPNDIDFSDIKFLETPHAQFLRITTNGEFSGIATVAEIEIWGNIQD